MKFSGDRHSQAVQGLRQFALVNGVYHSIFEEISMATTPSVSKKPPPPKPPAPKPPAPNPKPEEKDTTAALPEAEAPPAPAPKVKAPTTTSTKLSGSSENPELKQKANDKKKEIDEKYKALGGDMDKATERLKTETNTLASTNDALTKGNDKKSLINAAKALAASLKSTDKGGETGGNIERGDVGSAGLFLGNRAREIGEEVQKLRVDVATELGDSTDQKKADEFLHADGMYKLTASGEPGVKLGNQTADYVRQVGEITGRLTEMWDKDHLALDKDPEAKAAMDELSTVLGGIDRKTGDIGQFLQGGYELQSGLWAANGMKGDMPVSSSKNEQAWKDVNLSLGLGIDDRSTKEDTLKTLLGTKLQKVNDVNTLLGDQATSLEGRRFENVYTGTSVDKYLDEEVNPFFKELVDHQNSNKTFFEETVNAKIAEIKTTESEIKDLKKELGWTDEEFDKNVSKETVGQYEEALKTFKTNTERAATAALNYTDRANSKAEEILKKWDSTRKAENSAAIAQAIGTVLFSLAAGGIGVNAVAQTIAKDFGAVFTNGFKSMGTSAYSNVTNLFGLRGGQVTNAALTIYPMTLLGKTYTTDGQIADKFQEMSGENTTHLTNLYTKFKKYQDDYNAWKEEQEHNATWTPAPSL